jgi:hypothetical protein
VTFEPPTILRWLCGKTTPSILWTIWGAVFVGSMTPVFLPHMLSDFIQTVIGLGAFFGIPILIVFGFPSRYSSLTRRRIALVSLVVLLFVCVSTLLQDPSGSRVQLGDARLFASLIVTPLLFAPMFIATAVLGDANRSMRQYKPLDFFPTWLALFAFPFGGAIYVFRKLRPIVASLDSESIP